MLLLSVGLVGATVNVSGVDTILRDDFFEETPMELGRSADEQGEIANGRYIKKAIGKGNIAGSWDMEGTLNDGETYLITGKLRVVDEVSGDTGNGRVLLRFGSGLDLTGTGGQTEKTLFDQTISQEVEFSTYHGYSANEPNFGVLGINIGDGLRAEIYDVTFEVSVAPWSIIPHKSKKTLLINDVPVARNSMRVGTIPIPPGATKAHVKVTYALPEILSTAAIRPNVSARGAVGFNAKEDVVAPDETYFWRDGDDHDVWITFDIVNPSINVGDRFRASVGGKGITGWAGFDFEVVEGAINELPEKMPYHRQPYRLVLPDTPTLDLDMTTVEWDETGFKDGKPVWVTHPAYIHTQPGNSETGVYLPWAEQNAPGHNVHSLQVDAEGRPYVLLHTQKLPEPVDLGKGKVFPHQASMLQGQELDEWCHRRGIYSAQLLLPDRWGAWSAFWCAGRHGPTKNPMWPPEIDFMESFNGAYGAKYKSDTTSAGQHAGKHGSVKRERVDGLELDLIELGFSPELNFNTQIHDFTTVIEDEWVTHFRDGIEYFRHRNITDPADGNTEWDFYPIINVAVKDTSGGDYNEGSGDMRWYGLQYYAPDSEYKIVPYTHPKPYPNGELLPRPQL